jgi:hypothetical protein
MPRRTKEPNMQDQTSSQLSANDQAKLALAVDHIDATENDDGTWRYFDHATRSHWDNTTVDLIDLGERLANNEDDAYSHWCAATCGMEVENETLFLSDEDE